VLTTDVASVPFLWVFPLVFYLLAFVVVFKRRPWPLARVRPLLGWAVAVGAVLHLMTQLRLAVPAPLAVLLHTAILFLVCLNVTGKLAAIRPASPGHLTSFYLHMAVGGVIGSSLVSWLAPAVSNWLIEYPLSLAGAVAAVAFARGPASVLPARGRGSRLRTVVLVLGAVISVLAVPALLSRFLPHPASPALLVLAVGIPFVLILRVADSRSAALAAVLAAAMDGPLRQPLGCNVLALIRSGRPRPPAKRAGRGTPRAAW